MTQSGLKEPMTSAPEKDPRVYLAAQRTFLAWIRTGLALMGFGFVVARFGLFLRELAVTQKIASQHSFPGSVWLGTALVLAGVGVNVLSVFEHFRVIRDLNAGDCEMVRRPSSVAAGVAVTLVLVGLFMAVYLVFVP